MSKSEQAKDYYLKKIAENPNLSADEIWETFKNDTGIEMRKAHFKQNLDKKEITYKNQPRGHHVQTVSEAKAEVPVKKTPKEPHVAEPIRNRLDTLLTEVSNIEVRAESLKNVELRPEMFIGYKTGTIFDKLVSKKGGLMKGTINFITGESGAGKTTLCNNIIRYIMNCNEGVRAGFVSAEMDREDWKQECFDNNLLKDIEVIYLLDYLDDDDYLKKLKVALSKWDIIIVDSFEVILDQIKDVMGITGKKAESFLLNLMRSIAEKYGITYLVIQQFTKGGHYVGSTKLKHTPTSMAYVIFDENGERYIEFKKNRRGGHMVHKPLYFIKNRETGMLEFDEARFSAMQDKNSFQEEVAIHLKRNHEEFKELLDEMKDGAIPPSAKEAELVEESEEQQ